MAQTEDTELRDLVVEALEKNGSLAKIRALLRANVFLAFEEECENMKQNETLDGILQCSEGVLALSIVHEFLTFCNLKNTLFVYMTESRQGKEYNYDGKNLLTEKLNMSKHEFNKEPILVTLLKNALKPHERNHNRENCKNPDKKDQRSFKDDQNCTYIVHEDSQSSTANSQSDNSSDEKNKLHLRLQLDNSDTDTSSDSTREKSSSEYIPSEHIIGINTDNNGQNMQPSSNNGVNETCQNNNNINQLTPEQKMKNYLLQELKLTAYSSGDSTSYLDLKPYHSLDKNLLNKAGVPVNDKNIQANSVHTQPDLNIVNDLQAESASTASSITSNKERTQSDKKHTKEGEKKSSPELGKSDLETGEYSNDFSSSKLSNTKEVPEKEEHSSDSIQEEIKPDKDSLVASPHQESQSSQSSVSISDVADLISEKSSSFGLQKSADKLLGNHSARSTSPKRKSPRNLNKLLSDDSGDFTDSPIPSISNLSLDIHSD